MKTSDLVETVFDAVKDEEPATALATCLSVAAKICLEKSREIGIPDQRAIEDFAAFSVAAMGIEISIKDGESEISIKDNENA